MLLRPPRARRSVVGAGYSLSQEEGHAATLIKLMRVAMLLPVIALAAWLALAAVVRRRPKEARGSALRAGGRFLKTVWSSNESRQLSEAA